MPSWFGTETDKEKEDKKNGKQNCQDDARYSANSATKEFNTHEICSASR